MQNPPRLACHQATPQKCTTHNSSSTQRRPEETRPSFVADQGPRAGALEGFTHLAASALRGSWTYWGSVSTAVCAASVRSHCRRRPSARPDTSAFCSRRREGRGSEWSLGFGGICEIRPLLGSPIGDTDRQKAEQRRGSGAPEEKWKHSCSCPCRYDRRPKTCRSLVGQGRSERASTGAPTAQRKDAGRKQAHLVLAQRA